MSLSSAGQTGDDTVADVNGYEAGAMAFSDCVLGSVEGTRVVDGMLSGGLLGVVEGAAVIVMTLARFVVIIAALLSTGIMAVGPLVKF